MTSLSAHPHPCEGDRQDKTGCSFLAPFTVTGAKKDSSNEHSFIFHLIVRPADFLFREKEKGSSRRPSYTEHGRNGSLHEPVTGCHGIASLGPELCVTGFHLLCPDRYVIFDNFCGNYMDISILLSTGIRYLCVLFLSFYKSTLQKQCKNDNSV